MKGRLDQHTTLAELPDLINASVAMMMSQVRDLLTEYRPHEDASRKNSRQARRARAADSVGRGRAPPHGLAVVAPGRDSVTQDAAINNTIH